jgi:hypothetical protein
MQDTSARLALIEERNKRVELEKAWETSLTRTISILIITYVLATVVMYIIDVPKPYINSIIPTLGYLLSVQSLPMIRKVWIRRKKSETIS